MTDEFDRDAPAAEAQLFGATALPRSAAPSPAQSAYRVLARKYRPMPSTTSSARSRWCARSPTPSSSGRIHQAYMLTGVRGVGKTTTARILARAFNYELPAADGRAAIARPTIDMPELGVHCQAIIEFAPCRRDRDGCRLAYRHRRRARDHRERALSAGLGAHQGLHHRRSAHALEAGLQRSFEDARRAAGARQVPVRDDRDRESAGHGALALHSLRSAAHRDRRAGRVISPRFARKRVSPPSRRRWR